MRRARGFMGRGEGKNSYFSFSVARIFWSAGPALFDKYPLLCVFLYYCDIWTIVLQPLVRKDSHIPSHPHFRCYKSIWLMVIRIPLVGTLHCHNFSVFKILGNGCSKSAPVLWQLFSRLFERTSLDIQWIFQNVLTLGPNKDFCVR